MTITIRMDFYILGMLKLYKYTFQTLKQGHPKTSGIVSLEIWGTYLGADRPSCEGQEIVLNDFECSEMGSVHSF